MTQPPALYEGGQITSLGLLGGNYGGAADINSSAQIVGYCSTASGYVPFLYEHGQMNALSTLGGDQASANAINDRGEVAGYSSVDPIYNNIVHAFVYKNGQMSDLGTLGTYSDASGINNSGQIVGGSRIDDNQFAHAVLYENGAVLDLNSLIAPGSGLLLVSANDINDLGWIVGNAVDVNGGGRGFLLTPVPEPSCTMSVLIPSVLARIRRRRVTDSGT
jgi:probable HAF family extracellular repeat protein